MYVCITSFGQNTETIRVLYQLEQSGRTMPAAYFSWCENRYLCPHPLPPSGKLEALHELLMTFQSSKRASKRELESLIGKLNWACQVIQGGRTFLRRVINAKNTLHRQSDKVLLDCFRKDLEWWTAFLPVFNGTVRFLETRPVRSLMTDACNSGGGGYFHGDYFYVN